MIRMQVKIVRMFGSARGPAVYKTAILQITPNRKLLVHIDWERPVLVAKRTGRLLTVGSTTDDAWFVDPDDWQTVLRAARTLPLNDRYVRKWKRLD